jgi:hypothetical protein
LANNKPDKRIIFWFKKNLLEKVRKLYESNVSVRSFINWCADSFADIQKHGVGVTFLKVIFEANLT